MTWVRLGGSELLVEVRRAESEIQRRQAQRLSPVLSPRVLRVLAALPAGVAIPDDLLDASDSRLLRGLPESVVEWCGSSVRVVARPAITLVSIGAVAATWQRGLSMTGPYASYCARYVILDGLRGLRDVPWATAEARFYGVGLAVRADNGLDWKVAPAPFHAERFTGASWLMAEQVAEALGL